MRERDHLMNKWLGLGSRDGALLKRLVLELHINTTRRALSIAFVQYQPVCIVTPSGCTSSLLRGTSA